MDVSCHNPHAVGFRCRSFLAIIIAGHMVSGPAWFLDSHASYSICALVKSSWCPLVKSRARHPVLPHQDSGSGLHRPRCRTRGRVMVYVPPRDLAIFALERFETRRPDSQAMREFRPCEGSGEDPATHRCWLLGGSRPPPREPHRSLQNRLCSDTQIARLRAWAPAL